MPARKDLPDTLLGFETTGPLFLDCGSRGSVVASLWWWGVVFDLWIVVASIKEPQHECRPFGGGGCGVVFCCAISFESIGFVFVSV